MTARKTDDPEADFQSPVTAFAESPLGVLLLKMLSEGSGANRAIADYLLRNQIRVTAWGIEELAEHCKVSTASISRFTRELGFKNYAALRNEVALTLQSVLQPVEKLRNKIGRAAGSAHPAMESLDYAAANINTCKQSLDGGQLDAIAGALSKARTVYVMGFGLSAQLASTLVLHLQPFCQHVIDVAGQGGTEIAAGHLAHITSGDVLVVISFPRYSLDVIRLTGFARERNACIVAITDSPASALAGLATHSLYAQSEHSVLPSSATAAMAVIEALVVTLMVSNKENVAKAARLTDALSAWLYGPDAGTGRAKRDSVAAPKRGAAPTIT